MDEEDKIWEEVSDVIYKDRQIINKLKKEIEELKIIASKFTNRDIDQFSIGEFNFKVKHFEENYISKDKIREKIEKYKVLAEKSETEEKLYIYKNIVYALERLL